MDITIFSVSREAACGGNVHTSLYVVVGTTSYPDPHRAFPPPHSPLFAPTKTASVFPSNLFARPCYFLLMSPPDNLPAKVTNAEKERTRDFEPVQWLFGRNGLSSRGSG